VYKKQSQNNFIDFVLKIAFVRVHSHQSVPPILIQSVPAIPVKVYQCKLVL